MKMKWGIIGCGGIADRRTLPGMMLSATSEPYAVMDASLEVAERVKEKYGAKIATNRYEDILALPEVEAVYIASPVFCHKEQALAALAAGKPVLLEKPIGLSYADSVEIVEAFERVGVPLGIGFMMRYHAYHQAMRETVASGIIGDIVSMRAQFTCWYPDIEGAWRQEKSLSGGGALVDLGVHCIDLLQYISGLSAVECIGYTATQTFSYNVDDSAALVLKMNNGALAYVDCNFNVPDAAAVCPIEFYGTRGSIVAKGTLSQVEGGEVQVLACPLAKGYDAQQDRSVVEPVPLTVEFGNMYTKEIDAFAQAIREGEEPPVSGRDTLLVHEIVDAVYRGGGKLGK